MEYWFILFFASVLIPLLIFLWLALVPYQEKESPYIAFSGTLTSLVLFCMALPGLLHRAGTVYRVNWLKTAGFQFELGFLIDQPSLLLTFLVLTIGTSVVLFSVQYMKFDAARHTYFAQLSLFIFAMLMLVLSANLLQLFVFWELTGFCSFLLIGFYHEHKKVIQASRKAFLLNKLADLGFIAGLGLVFARFGAFDLLLIESLEIPKDDVLLWWASACFVLAAIGKSAQFPLMIWLPDAMAGPTPVSALIHAATMVVAGIFLLVRLSAIVLAFHPDLLIWLGVFTALLGALAATSQPDMKKTLAYSTISQLGIMVAAVGIGAKEAALFHLATHAFFKAGLFLSAGAVIFYIGQAGGQQQSVRMKDLGGMKQKLPVFFWLHLVCALSLAGFPFFSGFLSKEVVLENALVYAIRSGGIALSLPVLLLLISFLTAFYITRMTLLVWPGTTRMKAEVYDRLECIGNTFIIAIVPLALLSTFVFFSFNPFAGNQPRLYGWLGVNHEVSDYPGFMSFSIMMVAMGILAAYRMQDKFLASKAPGLLLKGFYLDFWYTIGIVKPAKVLAFRLAKAEMVLTKLIVYAGKLNVVGAHVLGWFDSQVLDGVTGVTETASTRIGSLLRVSAMGKTQAYFATLLSVVFIIMLILILS